MTRIPALKKYSLPGELGWRWGKKGQVRGVNAQSTMGCVCNRVTSRSSIVLTWSRPWRVGKGRWALSRRRGAAESQDASQASSGVWVGRWGVKKLETTERTHPYQG